MKMGFVSKLAVSAIIIVLGSFVATADVNAQEIALSTESKLKSFKSSPENFFGGAIDIHGDTVVVAAPANNEVAGTSGSAYVFVKDGLGWVEQAHLEPSELSDLERFGSAVAVYQDTAVVTVYDGNDDEFSGSAYVFVRDGVTWSQQAILKASDAAAGDKFGGDVAIHDNTIIVGAYGSVGSGFSGSAYVFVRDGDVWNEQIKLKGRGSILPALFGKSVSIDGDTAVVGAGFGSQGGLAYVFVRGGETWNLQARLNADDGKAFDFFGYSTAIADDTIVVGAGLNGLMGAAYVFVREDGQWHRQAKLNAGDGSDIDMFGFAADIEGDSVIIGAWGDDGGGEKSGSAYVFARHGIEWSEQGKLEAGDAMAGDFFGGAVALHEDTVVIAAVGDDDDGDGVGATYIHNLVWCRGYLASILGTDGDDVIIGTIKNDVIVGFSGNDDIQGMDGDDVICGGDGDDTIMGNNGNDLIEGEEGNDTVNGGFGSDIVHGGNGNDWVAGGWGELDGADIVAGGLGEDRVFGGNGNDELWGGGGRDLMYGGNGDDVIRGNHRWDLLRGGPGNDVLYGGEASDELFGDEGDDMIFGEDGDDIIDGGSEIDICDGGPGVNDSINCESP